jgi:hypothetical protein
LKKDNRACSLEKSVGKILSSKSVLVVSGNLIRRVGTVRSSTMIAKRFVIAITLVDEENCDDDETDLCRVVYSKILYSKIRRISFSSSDDIRAGHGMGMNCKAVLRYKSPSSRVDTSKCVRNPESGLSDCCDEHDLGYSTYKGIWRRVGLLL